MNLRSALGTLVLVLTLGAAVPAAQAQYPPTVGSGRVTRSELKQCQCTLFTGDGFEPGSSVLILDRGPDGIARPLGTATVDHKGEFRFKACFDENDDEGTHRLLARGTGANGAPREVSATVRVEGTICFRKGDEVHDPSEFDEDEDEEGRGEDGDGDGDGSAGGPNVGGDRGGRDGVGGLPRTGADYVLPGLLLGFLLVVTGTGAVHVARRRRLVAP